MPLNAMIRARAWLFILILAWGLTPSLGFAAAEGLRTARDFSADARVASEKRVPVLLFFTQANCPFCERARREYLRSMALENETGKRALYREVPIDGRLIDFDGRRKPVSEIAQRYGVKVFPTVVMVDAQGAASSRLLVGIAVPDFYGAYLNELLESAEAAIKK
jgi:thioredoxin-related protein